MKTTFQTVLFLYIFPYILTYTFKNKASSYLHYEQWNAEKIGVLKFKFKTYSPYGLLLYSDNSKLPDSIDCFISVKLMYGKIDLTVQMGSEDYKSKRSEIIGKNLNDLKWHTIEIQRSNQDTKLILDSKEEVVLINDGDHKTLDLNSGLFFGGISPLLSRSLIDQTIKSIPRFMGCIENIRYKTNTSSFDDNKSTDNFLPTVAENDQSSQNVNIEKLISSVDVETGCADACVGFTCPNGGKCINRFTHARCNCIGTGFTGKNCTKQSDAIEFKGNEYISVSLSGRYRTTLTNQIVLRFKTHESGVIMAADSGNDHLMLEIHGSIIQFSMNLGGGHHILRIDEISFTDGRWHVMEINRDGRDIKILVDNKYSINRSTARSFTQFDLREAPLYIGGHPEIKNLSKINSSSRKNFKGCLQQVFYNGLDIVYKALYTKSSLFNIVGAVKKGCSVVKRKTKNNRDIDLNVSSSSGNNGREVMGGNISTTPRINARDKIHSSDSNLSKKTVIWIAAGLILGFIVIIASLVLIVHNIRHRYSGVFLSSTFTKENNNQAKKPLNKKINNGRKMKNNSFNTLPNGNHHISPNTTLTSNQIFYGRKFNHVTIEPHLV